MCLYLVFNALKLIFRCKNIKSGVRWQLFHVSLHLHTHNSHITTDITLIICIIQGVRKCLTSCICKLWMPLICVAKCRFIYCKFKVLNCSGRCRDSPLLTARQTSDNSYLQIKILMNVKWGWKELLRVPNSSGCVFRGRREGRWITRDSQRMRIWSKRLFIK